MALVTVLVQDWNAGTGKLTITYQNTNNNIDHATVDNSQSNEYVRIVVTDHSSGAVLFDRRWNPNAAAEDIAIPGNRKWLNDHVSRTTSIDTTITSSAYPL